MRRFAALAALLLLASCKAAEPDIQVEDVWVRATLAGQGGSAAYFTLVNSGGADRLVGVSSPAAKASIHSTTTAGGVMRMRPLDGIDIPAGETVELKPGGTHVMLAGLEQPLTAGSRIALDLRFEKSGQRRIEASVRPASGERM